MGNHVLLVGMMGSGKSTVGRVVAARMARPFRDSDADVEARTGKSVPEIFSERGEPAFRAEERVVLCSALSSGVPSVIAVAGGAVLDPETRRRLRSAGVVLWLDVAPHVLAERVGAGEGRPLLEGDPAATLQRLVAARRSVYRDLADHVVRVEGRSPDALATEVVRAGAGRIWRRGGLWVHVNEPGPDGALPKRGEEPSLSEPVRVRVELSERGYDVLVGPGVRRRLRDFVPPGARRATVVTQEGIGVEVDPGIACEVVAIPGGERAKSLKTVEDICRFMAESGMHRGDLVVAVGGGVVSDVAGFAAASYHRGIAVVNVPTTLLGQVDAAIGGKTGVNIPEGKNLVGAFWQPRAVLCDTDTLASLPEREWRSGHGEMAKYAFLGVEDLDKLDLCAQVARCAALKAEVVAADERDFGRRVVLNYGHTLAHALEAAGFASEDANSPETQLRHGEAVGIGLVFAAELAHLLGRIGPQRVARHREVVAGYGLPVSLPAGAEASRLIGFMERDKKADGGLTMVLDGPGGVEAVRGVRTDLVHEALVALEGER